MRRFIKSWLINGEKNTSSAEAEDLAGVPALQGLAKSS
jgi:hypothetical protein